MIDHDDYYGSKTNNLLLCNYSKVMCCPTLGYEKLVSYELPTKNVMFRTKHCYFIGCRGPSGLKPSLRGKH